MGAIRVEPVEPRHWDDVTDLFQRRGLRGGTPQTDGCWCQFWRLRGKAWWDGHGAGHRQALRDEIHAGQTTRSLPTSRESPSAGAGRGRARRSTASSIGHARSSRRRGVWSIVCFYVHPTAKRQGVASALLDAAVDLARARASRWSRATRYAAGPHEHRLVHGLPADVPRRRLRGGPRRRPSHRRSPPASRLRGAEALCDVRQPDDILVRDLVVELSDGFQDRLALGRRELRAVAPREDEVEQAARDRAPARTSNVACLDGLEQATLCDWPLARRLGPLTRFL